jgi:hypothetical protein
MKGLTAVFEGERTDEEKITDLTGPFNFVFSGDRVFGLRGSWTFHKLVRAGQPFHHILWGFNAYRTR